METLSRFGRRENLAGRGLKTARGKRKALSSFTILMANGNETEIKMVSQTKNQESGGKEDRSQSRDNKELWERSESVHWLFACKPRVMHSGLLSKRNGDEESEGDWFEYPAGKNQGYIIPLLGGENCTGERKRSRRPRADGLSVLPQLKKRRARLIEKRGGRAGGVRKLKGQ